MKNSNNQNSKGFREMDFTEVSVLYDIFTENILDKKLFLKIKNKYQSIYEEFIKYKNKNYKSPTAMGRDEIQYGRAIIYGWFIEEIIFEILKQNKKIKEIKYFGDDKLHEFIYDHALKQIKIKGEKSTAPDLFIEFNNKDKLLLELKTGIKDLWTVKKTNVKGMIEWTAKENISSALLMIDIKNKLFEIKSLNYFFNQKPFLNASMENQLCYDFPRPSININKLSIENISTYIDKDIVENILIKKWRLYNIAKENKNKKIEKIIKAKLDIEKLEEEKEINIETINQKIQNIINKNPEVRISWKKIELELLK